jgi:hypothetical protein
MIYFMASMYTMIGLGYGVAVDDEEPSKFGWVGILSGAVFPLFLGVALCQRFSPNSPKRTKP